jgi:hypothetical protein
VSFIDVGIPDNVTPTRFWLPPVIVIGNDLLVERRCPVGVPCASSGPSYVDIVAVYEPASKLSATVHVVPFAFVVHPGDEGVSAALSVSGAEQFVHPAAAVICTDADFVDAETYCARLSVADTVPALFGIRTMSVPLTAEDVCVTEGVKEDVMREAPPPHAASVAHSSAAIERRIMGARPFSERRGRWWLR